MTAPIGWNAVIALGSPWTNLRITPVTVTTQATPLPTTALVNRKGLYLFHPGNTTVFLGDSNVGTLNDARLFGGQMIPFPVSADVVLYGRVASGSQVILIWEFTA